MRNGSTSPIILPVTPEVEVFVETPSVNGFATDINDACRHGDDLDDARLHPQPESTTHSSRNSSTHGSEALHKPRIIHKTGTIKPPEADLCSTALDDGEKAVVSNEQIWKGRPSEKHAAFDLREKIRPTDLHGLNRTSSFPKVIANVVFRRSRDLENGVQSPTMSVVRSRRIPSIDEPMAVENYKPVPNPFRAHPLPSTTAQFHDLQFSKALASENPSSQSFLSSNPTQSGHLTPVSSLSSFKSVGRAPLLEISQTEMLMQAMNEKTTPDSSTRPIAGNAPSSRSATAPSGLPVFLNPMNDVDNHSTATNNTSSFQTAEEDHSKRSSEGSTESISIEAPPILNQLESRINYFQNVFKYNGVPELQVRRMENILQEAVPIELQPEPPSSQEFEGSSSSLSPEISVSDDQNGSTHNKVSEMEVYCIENNPLEATPIQLKPSPASNSQKSPKSPEPGIKDVHRASSPNELPLAPAHRVGRGIKDVTPFQLAPSPVSSLDSQNLSDLQNGFSHASISQEASSTQLQTSASSFPDFESASPSHSIATTEASSINSSGKDFKGPSESQRENGAREVELIHFAASPSPLESSINDATPGSRHNGLPEPLLRPKPSDCRSSHEAIEVQELSKPKVTRSLRVSKRAKTSSACKRSGK